MPPRPMTASMRYGPSRWTEYTSLSCSRRERTARQLADRGDLERGRDGGGAVLARVSTVAATMLTFCSATMFVMSERRPVRS